VLILTVTMSAGLSLAQVPASNHVVLVVEQNHSYSSVVGSSAMPYLNSLALKYGLATRYYANAHPSIGDYFEMTTGQMLTNDDSKAPASFPVSSDNIVRQLMIAGKTWKCYAEGLPYAGYTGGNTGSYVVRHNPFAYFTDVQNSSTQKLNLVPFSQFARDLADNQLPNFSYIVPNLNNDAQNGTLQQADGWLKQNIAPLLANPAFQQDGLLIITFSESANTDTAHGGGQVATVVIGPEVKVGTKSTTLYQHQSLLRTVLTALGATEFPGAAASAPPMNDFFASSTTAQATASTAATTISTAGVTITSPANGATVQSPVKFVASATSSNSAYPISAMRIYVDNASMYTAYASAINTTLSLSAGGHSVTIVAWDSAGHAYSKSLSINVSTIATAGVTISSPANGATVTSPVNFVASAKSSNSAYPITAMRVYVDNASMYTVSAASLNTSLALPAGGHSVTIVAWDSSGQAYTKSLSINVTTSATGGVTISSPTNGTAVSSPVQFVASAQANSGNTITAMRIYVDNVSAYSTYSATLNTSLSLTSGAHQVIVQAWDNTGAVYKSAETITVSAPVGTLAISPTALSFGSVNVGGTASEMVTLTAGTAPVTVSAANITGAGFSFSGLTLPMTMAAGQSVSFSVKFAPTVAGSVSGTLSFASNASNSNSTIALSGTGTTTIATTHSTTLTWTASTSTNVVGYNVYRGTQPGGPYTKLSSAAVTGTTYTDSNVSAGATYYYVATAVDSSGVESGYSNSVTAVIPTP
jgi:hypothetical protein